jgi:glycerophosphoryl diester phosphodiesterase
MNARLQDVAMAAVDWLMASIPRKVPDEFALRNCKIISHRGEHDNINVMENTLQAYDTARANGVWGIEGDIRWTADLVPVICHDDSGERLFACDQPIHSLSFAEVRSRMPLIPSLAELLGEFGGNTHLMLELKAEPLARVEEQKRILQEHLGALEAGLDYHILALDPSLFQWVDFVPPRFCFPVAQGNVPALSRVSIDRGYGGLGGHYLLLGNKLQQRHVAADQRLGTGFVGSKNCLFRELNRGVEWIFSNDAVKIQKILEHYLQQ